MYLSQKGKKGTGKKPSGNSGANRPQGINKGIRAKPVPKRSNDK